MTSVPPKKKIESFQDLVVWQKSMDLVAECYQFGHRLPPSEQYGLGSQMRRAVVSIPANIAGGFGRWHSKEFVHFLLVANGSLKELETHLLIGKRLGFFSSPELTKPLGTSRRNRPHADSPSKKLAAIESEAFSLLSSLPTTHCPLPTFHYFAKLFSS
jgi:four helix bundle protein